MIGTLYDPSGDAQLCITKQHKTLLVTDGAHQAIIDKAPPGLHVDARHHAGPAAERDHGAVEVAGHARRQEGRRCRGVGGIGRGSKSVVNPALDAMGVERGTEAVLSITGSDTTAAQAQLDSFIERWKSDEHATR